MNSSKTASKSLKLRGFTLLELLVVMAIIGIMLYMIVRSMAIFRRNVELQEASDQTIAVINETKNYSNNNILPDSLVPDTENQIYGYAIELTAEDKPVRKLCSRLIAGSTWNCSGSEELLEDRLRNVVLKSSGCYGVLFVNLNGDVKTKLNPAGNYDSDGVCTFELSHKENSKIFRRFVFDGAKNNYTMQYGD